MRVTKCTQKIDGTVELEHELGDDFVTYALNRNTKTEITGCLRQHKIPIQRFGSDHINVQHWIYLLLEECRRTQEREPYQDMLLREVLRVNDKCALETIARLGGGQALSALVDDASARLDTGEAYL